MQRYSWPNQKSLLEFYQEANEKGFISLELKTNSEAEKFRFALYKVRYRSKQHGWKYKDFKIGVEKNKLTIYKPIEVEIKKTGT